MASILMSRHQLIFVLMVLAFVCATTAVPLFSLSPPSGKRQKHSERDTATPEPEESPAALLRSQWRNPKETLSVLLIIGGDIVQKAIAQMTGAMYLQVQKPPRNKKKGKDFADGGSKPVESAISNKKTNESTHARSNATAQPGEPEKGVVQPSTQSTPMDGSITGANAAETETKRRFWRAAIIPFMKQLDDIQSEDDDDGRDWRLNFTPVAFSFGWVGYAFSSLMSVFGEGLLMPPADTQAMVMNLASGTKKINESWVLGRLVRDLSIYAVDTPKRKGREPFPIPSVYFYKTQQGAGHAHLGMLWWTALIIPLQYFLASVPIWSPHRRPDERNWIILMITAIGTCLSLLTGAIPQWQAERFPARSNRKDNFILTKGNGHSVSYVILNPSGTEQSMNLEDLAVLRPEAVSSPWTKVYVPVLAVCWVLLLLCIGGLERDTWYLLGVGLLGMVQNVVIASWWKHPKSHGLPIEPATNDKAWIIEDREGKKIMKVLMFAELVRPKVGLSLLGVFFKATALRAEEKKFWDQMTLVAGDRDTERKKQGIDLFDLQGEIRKNKEWLPSNLAGGI